MTSWTTWPHSPSHFSTSLITTLSILTKLVTSYFSTFPITALSILTNLVTSHSSASATRFSFSSLQLPPPNYILIFFPAFRSLCLLVVRRLVVVTSFVFTSFVVSSFIFSSSAFAKQGAPCQLLSHTQCIWAVVHGPCAALAARISRCAHRALCGGSPPPCVPQHASPRDRNGPGYLSPAGDPFIFRSKTVSYQRLPPVELDSDLADESGAQRPPSAERVESLDELEAQSLSNARARRPKAL